MTRSALSAPSALTSVFVLALTAACGHSSQTLDAYEKTKEGNATPSTGGTSNPGNGGTGGTGNGGTGGTGNGTGGSSGSAGMAVSCDAAPSQQFDSAHMKAYTEPDDPNVASTLNAMTNEGRASQMLGVETGQMDYQDIERSPDVTVGGIGTIRGYNYRDAGRGVNLDAGQKNRVSDGNNYSTVFPAPSLRAASWDVDLEKRVGEAAGDETAASLNNMLLAPCMNIIRHPYWGRTQETYGEDSYHIGRMATAFTVGLQEYVTGCAKHFAANNIEKGRSTQNAIMNDQTLREIYARHFEMVVQDGGIGCVMASYNKINGTKSTQNPHLLRDILKGDVSTGGMGYRGLVISDWWAMPGDQNVPDTSTAQSATIEAVNAGLDIEVPWTLHFSTATLANADQSLVEDAARRVLRQKYRFKTAEDTDGWSVKAPTSTLASGTASIAANSDHEALAEEAAIKSAVLLQNGVGDAGPVLPLGASTTNLAVVGPDGDFQLASSSVPKTCGPSGRSCTFHFATDVNLGDRGSSRVNGDPSPAHSIGPFAGIQANAPTTVTVTSGNSVAAAMAADTVVVVVGYTAGDEGEEYAISAGGDRSTLNLPVLQSGSTQIDQNAFVSSVLDLGKPTVIVIESGSIVNLPWLTHTNKKQATIWAGYGGLRGGAALAKLIFAVNGANFSGKMPLAWPTQTELDVMPFKETDTDTHMGYFFGYREYDRRKYVAGQSINMIFPFGHGLSYSSFEYSGLMLPACQQVMKDAIVNVTVNIHNTSTVDGDEVPLLFVKPPAKPAGIKGDRPWKELKSFTRVSVPAGQTVTATLPLRMHDLRRWEPTTLTDPTNTTGKWVVDSGDYTIAVGKDADDAETTTNTGTLHVVGD